MKFKTHILLTVALLLVAGVLMGGSGASSADKVKVGEVAPSFTVMTPDGKLSNADLKGKVVLINFFATWCPPCVKELPVLQQQVWEKYKDHNDFVLLVIGREHSVDELRAFAEKRNLDLPFCPDEKREIFNLFASESIPRNYIIDRAGKVVYASKGYSVKEFEIMKEALKKRL
ncbi:MULTISPECIES: peroxiredoxin family protein [unclassified Carboxylicivirga]|uniref:peroxiredoxin family protein n=1 Tax=Carboxylicivirga TaxID=1628153 RepID=UPI003D35262F